MLARLVVLASLLTAHVVLACVGAPICAPPLPPGSQPVPANAVALVGFVDLQTDAGTLTLFHLDGGAEVLPRLRVVPTPWPASAVFSAPASWAVGELVQVRSDVRPDDVCSRADAGFPSATFRVAPPVALPTSLGTLVVGPPVGFSNTDPHATDLELDCSGIAPRALPGVTRSLTLQVTPEVLSWLPLARMRRDGATPGFWGHLAGGNAAVELGGISAACEKPEGVKQVPLSLELEIAGVPETVKLDETIEFDCTKAGPRVGCSAAPSLALAALATWLARRRRARA